MSAPEVITLDVAILGGGFAGVYCARTAAKALRRLRGARVGLISEENYMVFQPMLPEVAGSAVSPRHVVNPLRLLCRAAEVFKGRVEEIDWPGRCLVLNAGAFSGKLTVRFEHLVLALGAAVDLSRIPGMPEHAFLMRNVGDAMHLRTTIIGRIEEANLVPVGEIKRRLLTFVVVGGGYSGVETAGHILDLFRAIHVYYPNVSLADLRVCLVHSRDHLLPTLSQRLGEYAASKLAARGLQLVLNQRVKAVTADRVHLEDGSAIESNTVICTVGNAPHPLVARLCAAGGFESAKGQIATEPTGQVKGQTHLWAAGDCAAVPFVKGGLCPDTAQFAMRQGVLIGQNIGRIARAQAPQPFTFEGYGEMASIGHYTAVAEIFRFRFSGFFAWWLWRTVYLMKLPRLDRKIRVMVDWTLDLFFPLDINHLSPRFSALLKEIYLQPGDILFHRGEPAFSLYIVKSGCLELQDSDGWFRKIAAGDHVGEQPLLHDGIWQYTATAIEPTLLVSVPAGIFRQLVEGSGSIGRWFQKSAARYHARDVLEAIRAKLSPELAAAPAAELMERHLHTLRSESTVREALALAQRHPRSSYPVVDECNRLLGMLNRDDFYDFIKRPATSLDVQIDQVPLAKITTARPETTVAALLDQLLREGANKAVIVDDEQRVLGIITVADILAAESRQPQTGHGKV